MLQIVIIIIIISSIIIIILLAFTTQGGRPRTDKIGVGATKQRQTTWKTSAHLLCAPIRRIYRGGRRHHADMSVVVPITLSCRPRVLRGHKVTWNISTTDIVTGTDTDFVGACTPAFTYGF
jgi:hypothetical protein